MIHLAQSSTASILGQAGTFHGEVAAALTAPSQQIQLLLQGGELSLQVDPCGGFLPPLVVNLSEQPWVSRPPSAHRSHY